jgi:hypothetical protein
VLPYPSILWQVPKILLKARHRLHYRDDLLLSVHQAQLADWERQIEAFLAEHALHCRWA